MNRILTVKQFARLHRHEGATQSDVVTFFFSALIFFTIVLEHPLISWFEGEDPIMSKEHLVGRPLASRGRI